VDFPSRIDELDAAWLSDALGMPVAGYRAEFIEGGVLSDAYVLRDIAYHEPRPSAPSSLVVKFASQFDDRRAYALSNNAYATELNFYRDLAQQVPLRTPTIHALHADDESRPEFFVIVMEDLCTHSKVFDQVEDPPDEHFMRRIALELAQMHAQFWEAPQLRGAQFGGGRFRFSLQESCLDCVNHHDEFFALWRQMFGIDLRDEPGCAQTRAISEIVAGPNGAGIVTRICEVWNARPWTLLHGDMRADNIFRTQGAADARLTYVDWQLVMPGPPGIEFTQAWQHSAHPELRRKDRAILAQYHDRLTALNPAAAAYPYEVLLDDYKLGYVLWWMALISLGAATLPVFDKPEGARMKRLWGQGLRWMNIAMTDLDCLSLVESLAAES
jgi:Ecdysteroid kinase-like family